MLRTVLLAYDGSDESEEALSLAIELVRCLQADMHIVTVVDVTRALSSEDVEAGRRYAWQRLRDAEVLTARSGLTVRLDVVKGEPAVQILERARELTADIIVLGHASHGRIDRLTGGSVAGPVLERAPCAVLMSPVRASQST